jgi:hypothetical protein
VQVFYLSEIITGRGGNKRVVKTREYFTKVKCEIGGANKKHIRN